jgi:hypothetical protein
MFASARRNHCSPAASNDFCNKIGQNRTFLTSKQLRVFAYILPLAAVLSELPWCYVGGAAERPREACLRREA